MEILLITIVIALIYELVNGAHDCANAIATSIATKALSKRRAIMMAATLNLFGALITQKVAKTISGSVLISCNSQLVILCALLGAIIWNLITWYLAIPSSSSHALIGGLLGAGISYAGLDIVKWSGIIYKIIIPIITSPLIGFGVAYLLIKVVNKINAREGLFKKLQIASAGVMAYAHGTNDSQNAMGVITLALVSAGVYSGNSIPIWVIILCALTMGLGTAIGGWKIIRTMGFKLTKLNSKQGFVAETSAALVIESMSLVGAPVSTTHCISSAIIGSGVINGKKAIGWSVVKNMLIAWILTMPAAGLVSFVIFKCLEG